MIFKKKVFFKNGLYVLISTKNKMYYRFRYFWDGRDRCLSLGVCDDTSFVDAYQRAMDANELINQGIDPSEFRKDRPSRLCMGFRAIDPALKFPDLDTSDTTYQDMLAKWQDIKNQYKERKNVT